MRRLLLTGGAAAAIAGGLLAAPVAGQQALAASPLPAVEMLAQNASDGLLWAVNPDGSNYQIGNGLGVQSGTNLAMAPLTTGGFQAAWNGGGGQLWTIGPVTGQQNTGYMMPPGFTPAIAPLDTGGSEILYQNASDGLLYALNPGTGADSRIGNGLGMVKCKGTAPMPDAAPLLAAGKFSFDHHLAAPGGQGS